MPKKNLSIILTVAIVLMAIIFIYVKTRPKVIIENDFFTTSASQTGTSFNRVTYTGDNIKAPSRLPALTISSTSATPVYKNIFDYCQIQENEVKNDGLIYFYGNLCDYYIHNDIISLTTLSDTVSEKTISFTEADNIAQTFIRNIYNSDAFALAVNLTPAIQTDTSIDLAYSVHYHDIPIYDHEYPLSAITLQIDGDNTIAGALPASIMSAQPQEQEFPTLSINQALSNIKNNKAYLASYNDYNYGNLNSSFVENLSTLTNISLSTAVLEYRLNDAGDLAIPSYHFSGTANDTRGNKMDVDIITPAINFTIN
jgi:hypothetical protein